MRLQVGKKKQQKVAVGADLTQVCILFSGDTKAYSGPGDDTGVLQVFYIKKGEAWQGQQITCKPERQIYAQRTFWCICT